MFRAALRLGLTSFGGPVAHIGYFRDDYVARRHWLDERQFGELVALTNLLPGPSSSQLGIAIGVHRAGKLGGLAAWLGFTLPSAVILTALALLGPRRRPRRGRLGARPRARRGRRCRCRSDRDGEDTGSRPGSDGPRGSRGSDRARASGRARPGGDDPRGRSGGGHAFRSSSLPLPLSLRFAIGRRTAVAAGTCFVAMLVGLPIAADLAGTHSVALASSFYRAGALVFGGGHVVLPLLNDAVVETGWVSQQAFLAGYGAAQAVPGPLFTFSAYLGAIEEPSPNGIAGAAIALLAIFLPSFLLLGAVLPLWASVRERGAVQAAVAGIGAAVVGLLARRCGIRCSVRRFTASVMSCTRRSCSGFCGSCRRGPWSQSRRQRERSSSDPAPRRGGLACWEVSVPRVLSGERHCRPAVLEPLRELVCREGRLQ